MAFDNGLDGLAWQVEKRDGNLAWVNRRPGR